ncbi:unnamed protein product [Staurois parvus]|uniref:Uncharacterized protein n=1 Tax=Staurois parvus TaxID=386267 RepID=A0ABN9HL81_9NEOB|nr:unnamed protein product [Staurois parvus]
MQLSKMSWHIDSLRVPFTGNEVRRSFTIDSADSWQLHASACADTSVILPGLPLLFPVASTLL